MSYTTLEGLAHEITLSNGHKFYTGINSINTQIAKSHNLIVKTVTFKGCCISSNINERAKDVTQFPIEIEGINIYDFIDIVADEDEKII